MTGWFSDGGKTHLFEGLLGSCLDLGMGIRQQLCQPGHDQRQGCRQLSRGTVGCCPQHGHTPLHTCHHVIDNMSHVSSQDGPTTMTGKARVQRENQLYCGMVWAWPAGKAHSGLLPPALPDIPAHKQSLDA